MRILRRALYGLLLLLVVGLLVVGALAWRMRGPGSAVPRDALAAQARPSLAVLPFVDLSQARDQDYLADGLAEEIRDQLAQSPALRVAVACAAPLRPTLWPTAAIRLPFPVTRFN